MIREPRRVRTARSSFWLRLTFLAVAAPAAAQDAAFVPVEALPQVAGNACAVALPDGDALVFGSEPVAQRFDHRSGATSVDGALLQSHVYAQAILLTSGDVLLAGGTFTAGDGSAELYDPVAHRSRATGTMGVGRWNAATAALPDGRVFFAGGTTDLAGTPTDAVEVYDVAAGRFTAAGHLTKPRAQATATALPDGTVLVAGGLSTIADPCPHSAGVQQCSAERCDPASGVCEPTGSMGEARWSSVATALRDGRVVVSGGWTAMLSSQRWADGVAIYDPATGTFAGAGVGAGQYRLAHTATLLRDGEVLLVGGVGLYSNVLNTSALLDPATLQIRTGPTLAVAHDSHAAALLADGRVLVAGGETYDAASEQRLATAEAEVFVKDGLFASGFEAAP